MGRKAKQVTKYTHQDTVPQQSPPDVWSVLFFPPHRHDSHPSPSSGTGAWPQSSFPATDVIPVLSAESPPSPSLTVPALHMTPSCVCPQGFTCSGQEAGRPDEE